MLNPCFECLCIPICSQKHWRECVTQCDLLFDVVIDIELRSPKSEFDTIVQLLKSKEIFKEEIL